VTELSALQSVILSCCYLPKHAVVCYVLELDRTHESGSSAYIFGLRLGLGLELGGRDSVTEPVIKRLPILVTKRWARS